MAFECTICGFDFPLRKTLNRHLVTVHQRGSFSCSHCLRTFDRKDTLRRHQQDRHGDASTKAHCSTCNVEVGHRSLSAHLKSDRHRRAQHHAHGSLRENMRAVHDMRASGLLQMDAMIDPRLVTSFFFYKMIVFGSTLHSTFWVHPLWNRTMQLFELEGQALRSIKNMLEHHSSSARSELLAPIAIMAVVETLIGGRDISKSHVRYLTNLIRRGHVSAEQIEWITVEQRILPSDAGQPRIKRWFTHVDEFVSHVIRQEEEEVNLNSDCNQQLPISAAHGGEVLELAKVYIAGGKTRTPSHCGPIDSTSMCRLGKGCEDQGRLSLDNERIDAYPVTEISSVIAVSNPEPGRNGGPDPQTPRVLRSDDPHFEAVSVWIRPLSLIVELRRRRVSPKMDKGPISIILPVG